MIKKIPTLIILLFLGSFQLFAQPNLVLSTNEVEFEDDFDRLLNILLVNNGNQPVVIDTIMYNSDFYSIRFDTLGNFPLIINPNDTVKMDLLLAGYYFVTLADTVDTLVIQGNLQSSITKSELNIKVEIEFFDGDQPQGVIEGTVKEGGTFLKDAIVLFFYDGIYNIREVKTDSLGGYSTSLPKGNYIIAAAKDSYYVSFYDQKFDPLEAQEILLESDSTKIINFNLTRMSSTGKSVGGLVLDSKTNSKLETGIVIVRKGKHTPSKISFTNKVDSIPNGVYSTLIRPDGTYLVDNILLQDYYFVQSFSNYYLPAYYSSTQTSSVFWQQSDSVLVNGTVNNINLSMSRDSAFGKGSISGTITLPQNSKISFSDIIVYANSNTQNIIFNYSYVDNQGNYQIINLPQGSYKIIAQNIGDDDVESVSVTVDTLNIIRTGVDINYNVNSNNDNQIQPNNFKLFQNYPNPFNPTTTIRFTIPNTGAKTTLIVYNLLGKEVATLVSDIKPAGSYEVQFNASNLASGVYFYRLSSGNFIKVKKLILLK